MHHVVAGLLVRSGTVLLCHRRADRSWYPDCWDLPGGHVEGRETERDALVRECREELGVTVLDVTVLDTAAVPAGRIETATVTLTVLRVTAWSGEPVNLATAEHDAVGWFAGTDLDGLTLADPALAPVLRSALDSADGTR